MAKRLSAETIERIKKLRGKGWSLPEIQKELKVGHGSIFRYIHGVEILPEYRKIWFSKRGGSIKRKKIAEEKASKEAKKAVSSISLKEKLIFLSALYWGEGSKTDFGLSNTDPELIKVFIKGLEEVFGVTRDRFRISIRIYEDLDKSKCLNYWSHITGVPVDRFVSVNILKGKKAGKLLYGMCRVRITKGGDVLKYMKALKNEIISHF